MAQAWLSSWQVDSCLGARSWTVAHVSARSLGFGLERRRWTVVDAYLAVFKPV
jgi:hypothetical protein